MAAGGFAAAERHEGKTYQSTAVGAVLQVRRRSAASAGSVTSTANGGGLTQTVTLHITTER